MPADWLAAVILGPLVTLFDSLRVVHVCSSWLLVPAGQ
jgi:hypothetical protein